MAPTFVAKPTIRQDADGTTLIFHCSIMADPRPSISWFRNGVKVQDNEKFQVGGTDTQLEPEMATEISHPFVPKKIVLCETITLMYVFLI